MKASLFYVKRRLPLTFALFLLAFNVPAQDGVPTAAPKADAFSLSSDNLGGVANSVNLFTGDVNLPLNLVSLPGRDGLSIDVSIFYNSAGIENIVDIWNLEAPTGILGLGWSMPYPMIVVDNKQTGARDDDEFYLVEGGSSTRLICVGNTSGVKEYKTKIFTNWIVKYTALSEKWEITREDGKKYIYGDSNSGRNTVQWVVKWGNWIGNSGSGAGQGRQGLVWNLSEVINLWGEKITYTYLKDKNFVGSGNWYHTEACYLQKINDPWGHEVEFQYKNKLAEEYMEPHTEQVEPDAYQERYEKRFLDRLIVKTDNVEYYQVHFNYFTNSLGTGSLTKRLLKKVVKLPTSQAESSEIELDYYTAGSFKGLLSKLENSLGGSVLFEYSAIQLTNGLRNKTISAPAGYAEPRVFIEEDYVLVTWRQLNAGNHDTSLRPVQAFAYTWDGRWIEHSLGVVGNVTILNDVTYEQDFQVVTTKNFFALLIPGAPNHDLKIGYKSERVSGDWSFSSYPVSLGSATNEKLLAGDRFVAVVDNLGKVVRHRWDGYNWNNVSTVTETSGTHFSTAGSNYIISHNTVPNPDAITVYYLNEQNEWQSTSTTNTFDNGSGDSYWHPANSFATVMASSNNEFIFQISETYGLIKKDLGFGYPDNSWVFTTGNSQVSIIGSDNSNMRSFRYTGSNWIDTGNKDIYNKFDCSVSPDLMIWATENFADPRIAYSKTFNPNSLTWSSDVNYNFNANPMFGNQVGYNPSECGIDIFIISDMIYFRKQNGSWPNDSNLTPVSYGSGTYLKPNSFRSGLNFFAYQYQIGSSEDLYVQFIKNGTKSDLKTKTSRTFFPRNGSSLNISHLGPTSAVLCYAAFSPSFQDANSLELIKIRDFEIEGSVTDLAVSKITIEDETGSRTTSFSYEPSNAGGSGYNKVTVLPGTDNPSNFPFGKTEYYFFNGLSESLIGETFPSENINHDAASYPKVLTGQPYRVKVLNNLNSVVSETTNYWGVEEVGITNGGTYSITKAYVPQLLKQKQNKDGIGIVNESAYNSKMQLLSTTTSTTGSTSGKETVQLNYKYWWQEYDESANNLLSPIIGTWKSVDGQVVESSATRWKNWTGTTGSVQAPCDSYAWKGTGVGTHLFSYYDAATQTPSSDWSFNGQVNVRDASSGLPLEGQGKGNQFSATILNDKKRAVIATVDNAISSEVAFTSFEDPTNGNWTWSDGTITTGVSKTGEKYFGLGTSGMTKSGLTSSEHYKISFWAKTSGGSVTITGIGTVNLGSLTEWTLKEFEVTGQTSVTLQRSGGIAVDIDEVRLHPADALMSTSTYHPLFGQTSTTDANNKTIYTGYDDFGRVKLIKDEKNDVVKAITHHAKE